MAIGTAAAIGLGVAGVGSVLSSRSSNSASRRAAETSADNNAQNNALAREIYGNNQQVLSPFMSRGNAAGNQINALLGLGGAPQAQAGAQPTASGTAPYGGAGAAYGLADGVGSWSSFGNPQTMGSGGFNPAAYGDATGNTDWSQYLANLPQFGGAGGVANTEAPATTGGTATPTTGQTAQQAAEAAFDTFRNSTGYQFRLGQGMDAINSGYAGAGTLQSGAALQAINEYGQNFASNEFANYMNALGAQQSVGAGAASSLAGVGQNYASQVINNNNQNAANQMNAQLSRQNGFANALGVLGGGAFQYGLGGLGG